MNDENIKKQSLKTNTITIIALIFFSLILFTLWFKLPKFLDTPKEQTPLVACRINLRQLGLAMQMYADESSGTYPTLDKWCDLIKPYFGRDAEAIMRCPAIKDGKCHYAMNPDCEPNSPKDTVLLFETKGGWNLTGGPELLAIENHSGTGCNILFNDGSVNYIQKDEITNLKWNTEEKNE